MMFFMTHPLVMGKIKIELTKRNHRDYRFVASTESGAVLAMGSWMLDPDKEEIRKHVHYRIGKKLM